MIHAFSAKFLDRAAQVRQLLCQDLYDDTADRLSAKLFYPSSFALDGGQQRRGYCNWVIPGRLMIGQYPAQTPAEGGPTYEEVRQHVQLLVEDAKIGLFCSLQSELPPQDDYDTWAQRGGLVFLEPQSLRQRFPHPFTHYAPMVKEFWRDDDKDTLQFLHCPIEDLNVPESQEPLQQLLLDLLNFLLTPHNKKAIYLHCWGGRGRAGLVGSCLLSLLYPSLSPTDILRIMQTAYASRLGHDTMPSVLSRSPQTDVQRAFVTQFVHEYQRLLQQANN
ncbi:expressed unknown protein [Seminavis robusta]|uniref:Swiss Army Knife protein DSP-PTPase phosphatase domain-containing protein n=1 Tax=Seminavis robusta TaxID=568900 RepID=A0A9N8HIM4_9STRA|nr:expressed unknown protein [Seminavis robusta]|eukprot:Sro708_g190650.1 n/a (276) ;mRNA; f:1345-2172